jgi:hypothetical protein
MSDAVLAELARELRGLEQKRLEGPLTDPEVTRRQELLDQLVTCIRQHPGEERREHLRVPAVLEVRFRMGAASVACAASELSQGGVGLRGHLWISEDQELVLENLRMGSRDYPIEVNAKVVWKVGQEDQPPGAGLCFLEIDEEGRQQIRTIFERVFLTYLDQLAQPPRASSR